jgi:DNA-binding NarL/FixJ family response regulator
MRNNRIYPTLLDAELNKGTTQLNLIHRNKIFGECLCSILNQDHREVRMLEPRDESALAETLEDATHDLFVIDAHLTAIDPLRLVSRIREEAPDSRVMLMLGSQDHFDTLASYLRYKIRGCVLEDGSLHEMRAGIERVIGGESFYPPKVLDALFDHLLATPPAENPTEQASQPLTPREEEIFAMIARGMSNKQIAKQLSLSLFTIKNHVHNVLDKLQVSSRYDAVAYLRQRGWKYRPPS